MLNESLEKLVRARIEVVRPIIDRNFALAEEARQAGDMKAYLAKRYIGHCPDLYWMLEEYDVAKHYYRLAAGVRLEERIWYEAHDPTYLPLMDRGLAVDAPVFIQAGMLDQGKEWLERAYRWEMEQKDGPNHYHMRNIGLFAAQAGMKELAGCVQYYVDAQLHMLRRSAEKTRRAAIYIHHIEPAEAQFLLGEFEESKRNLEQVLEGERFCQEQKVTGYHIPASERNFIFKKAKGLYKIIGMLENGKDGQSAYKEITAGLEKAMMWAWRQGDVTSECYRLRLYTLMAKDILQGRKPNPNPFAEISSALGD
ncbi:MAG: hypothetical protein EPO21_11380 [Chloroflexota bacterium]|nr:MAG: hypothetical protein EPO21_11380 [Chloroflexota bacterium]